MLRNDPSQNEILRLMHMLRLDYRISADERGHTRQGENTAFSRVILSSDLG
jgi:hypothetical protein